MSATGGIGSEGWVRSQTGEPLVAHQHGGYVQLVGGGRAWFAVCASCGWQGRDRRSEPDARADLAGHIAGTGYRFRRSDTDGSLRGVRRGG